MLSPEFYRKFAIYGGGFFFAITSMAQPYFTLYAQEVGASMAAIGFMVTMRSLLPIFIAMPVGQWVDSVGSLKMLKIGSVLLILSLFTNMVASGLFLLALSQVFMGASIIMMATSFQVMVSEGSQDERNENIKRYSMWMSAGSMLGPLLGGAVTSMFAVKLLGYKATFGMACVISILFFLFLLFISRGYSKSKLKSSPAASTPPPQESEKQKGGILESYKSGFELAKNRSVQFGLIATFLIMYIQALYMSFMPIYLDELGYATLLISAVISLHSLASMLSRYLLQWVMRLMHLERILLIAGAIASVCLLFTPVAAMHIAGLFAAVLIMGAAVGINLPVSMMIMVNPIGESDRGKVMGLRLLANRFSQIISPAMFGVLGHTIGLTAAFVTGGAFLLALMAGFSLFASAKLGSKTVGTQNESGKKPEKKQTSPISPS